MTEAKQKEIKIEMPTSVYQAANLRDLVFAVAQNVAGFSARWAHRLQAVIDELCNNAIEHGSAKDDMLRIILQVTSKERLIVIVEDSGNGPEKATAADLQKHIEKSRQEDGAAPITTALRGRGLARIVHAWTDEIKFEDIEGGGIRAIITKEVANAAKEEKEAMTEEANTDTIARINFA